MDRATANLRDYYEAEAEAGLRLRRSVRGRRAELRDHFIARLAEEGRASLIDLGAGPGRDGGAFRAAGLRVVGVDLAIGNGRLAAEADLTVIQGSLTALPFRSSAFEAGWCASTLMHLSEEQAATAIDEMVRVVRPGSPILVGMWGSESERSYEETADIPGQRRLFCLRGFDRNRGLLGARCDVEEASCWDAFSDDLDYHVFRLRSTGPQGG